MAEPSLYERRTGAEWLLLRRLAALNPSRLSDVRGEDDTFSLVLTATPGLLLDGTVAAEHPMHITFPVHYPAVPMTLHLSRPVWHPNVHPVTGFVCLWRNHRMADTVEHAVHKTAAMLGLQLYNAEAVHVMQPDALRALGTQAAELQVALYAPPLRGLVTEAGTAMTAASEGRRVRLS